MARKRKSSSNQGGASGGGWIVTYADLMSLLLIFFILLFSMSNVNEEKFTSASESMQVALGSGGGSLVSGNGGAIGIGGEDSGNTSGGVSDEKKEEGSNQEPMEVLDPELLKMYNDVVRFLEENELTSQVTVDANKNGLFVDIQESILFSSGSADVSASGRETLETLSEMIASFDNQVIIEGYTDDVPVINAQFDTNWELSTARAVSVLRYISEEKGIDPSRLSARGYGEHSPIVPNDSAENRAKNRRVNIVIVYEGDQEEGDE